MATFRKPFEDVARAELPVLYRVATRLTRNEQDAEDLVGRCLLLASKAWDSFDGRYARSWLIRILKNEFLNSQRVVKNQPSASLDDVTEPSEDNFWAEISDRALVDALMDELDKLPDEYRLAVALCDIEGLSYEEAAEALEVPIGTVRSRLFRGRRMLRAGLAYWQDSESPQMEVMA